MQSLSVLVKTYVVLEVLLFKSTQLFIGERARLYLVMSTEARDIYFYSILHILTIVFPDTRNVKYLAIFKGSCSTA